MKKNLLCLLIGCLLLIYNHSIAAPIDDLRSTPINDLRSKAEKGDAKAQFNLGYMYQVGDGVPKNSVEAVKWYRKAADSEYVPAQFNLGNMYYMGDGVPKDFEEAVKLFRKAADQGLADAQYYLGVIYYAGKGVPKDLEEAAKWYRKSAEQEFAEAQCNIALMYKFGEGVPKDSVEAVKWLRKATEKGHAGAQSELGVMYAYGEGVPKDEVEALAWFYLSVASGNGDAVKNCNIMERKLGQSLAIVAQQRSKEISAQIEKNKQAGLNRSSTTTEKASQALPIASGSGVFLTSDGLLITAAHVVKGSTKITALTSGGEKRAQILKIDTANDIAILKCSGTFEAVPLKPSKKLKLGQTVFTLGFPNIELQGFSPKMTKGEISSLSGIQDDPRQWQISVPVQPGNSGGGLFDEDGNLVGIVVSKLDAKYAVKYTGDLPENINYAVKSSYILPMLDAYADKLPPENAKLPTSGKLEDTVEQTQKSVALILVY